MHGQVDTTVGQRLFNLLGKHAFRANFGQSDVSDFVAGSLDDLEVDFVAMFAKQRTNVVSLPKSKLRASGTNS
jgi:hypothetical protein